MRLTPLPDAVRGLLRPRPQRPRSRRVAEHYDEFAPFHCSVASVLSAERVAHITRQWLLHCGISIWPLPASGQIRSFGFVGSMSGLPESGHGWAIYEYTP